MYKGNRSYRNSGATQRKSGTVFLTCVVLGAASFVRAETYYYVGGTTSEAFAAAANWATADGTVCESDPVADEPGNTFIFTNDTHVVFTKDVSVSTHIVKRGTGKLVFGNADLNIAGGKLTFESGYFAHGESTLKYTKPGLLQISDSFSLEVGEGAEKYFYIYGDGEEASHRDIVIPSYRELTPAAGTNLTFYLSAIPADSTIN